MRSPTRIRPLAMSALLTLAALLLPGAGAAVAAAGHPPATVAPPGDSGITQYLEVVPSASGAVPPRTGGGAGPTGGGRVLSAAQRRGLDNLGADGRRLAGVVGATAPAATPGGRVVGGPREPGAPVAPGQAGAATAQSGGTPPNAAGASPASLILDATAGHGSGGLGVFLPAFMLSSALAAGAYALRRRRTHP